MPSKRSWIVALAIALALVLTPLLALWINEGRAFLPADPPLPPSLSFAAVGDLGSTGDPDMRALAQRLSGTNAAFLLALGDLGYAPDESAWCSDIKSRFNDVIVIGGNHDVGQGSGGDIAQYATFCPFTLGVPLTAGPDTPGYGFEYYFDYPASTPFARFILISAGLRGSLNYDYSPGSIHHDWVVNAVQDARTSGIPWVVVGLHMQCVGVGPYGCSMGQAMFDKLVDLKVDLILQAHEHTYQRSAQLALQGTCSSVSANGPFNSDCVVDSDDAYTKGNGSVFVINGAGGRGCCLYDITIDGADPHIGYLVEAMGQNTNTKGLTPGFGSTIFTLNATHLDVSTDFAGTFQDMFSISSSDTVPPPPVPPPIPIPPDVGAPPGYGLLNPSLLEPRGPIYIGSNADFTAANGVRQGNGTASNPYVIRDWLIDGNAHPAMAAAAWIETTDRYVTIENIHIVNLNGVGHWAGIQIGRFPEVVVTQNVTIRHNLIESSHAYGIWLNEGTANAMVEANHIRLDADRDWVYGAATMRDTHNITFFGNFVNAYTSGPFRTVGIHLSDFHVGDVRRATSLAALRNTVQNATAGGIVSESSTGTVVSGNLVYHDYPGVKVVAPDYPRGIMTEWSSNDTRVFGNFLHTLHWGIQVGSDRGEFHSNWVYKVDDGIHVLDRGAWQGISSEDEVIYNTSYADVAQLPIRLPANPNADVLDVSPGVTPANVSGVFLLTRTSVSGVTYAWEGRDLNVSVLLRGASIYDVTETSVAQDLRASWLGALTRLSVSSFRPAFVSFYLETGSGVSFEGSGFLSVRQYNVTRHEGGVDTVILVVASDASGGLRFALPVGPPGLYSLAISTVEDLTPPTTTASINGTSGNNGWYRSPVVVTLNSTDLASGVEAVFYRVNGGPWTNYTSPWPVGEDGRHTIEYYAVDAVRNSEPVQEVALNVDTGTPGTTPLLVGDLQPDGSYVDTVAVTLTATDATSGVFMISYRIGNDPWQPYIGSFNIMGSGDHALEYYAVDVAGNEEPVQILTVPITEAGAPIATLLAAGTLGTNGWYVSVVWLTFEAQSPNGSRALVLYRVNGGPWGTNQGPIPLGDGIHLVEYRAMDFAGRVAAVQSEPFRVDSTAPVFGPVFPMGVLRESQLTVTWNASDATSGVASFEVGIDGGPSLAMGTNTSLAGHWTPGAHRVVVRATDAAGNTAVALIVFRVDIEEVQAGLSTEAYLYLLIGVGLSSVVLLLVRRGRKTPVLFERR